MALENYLNYIEVEPDDRIQRTGSPSNHIDIEAIRSEHSYVYMSKGIGHFNENFEHDVNVLIDAIADYGNVWCWILANNIGAGYPLRSTYDMLGVRFDRTGNSYRIMLEESVDGSESYVLWTGFSLDTPYYLKIIRNEAVGTYGTLYLGVYSTDELRDAGDATDGDVTNLSRTLREKEDFEYVYPCASGGSAGAYTCVADIENHNLHEVAPPVVGIDGGITTLAKILNIRSLVMPKFKPLFSKFSSRKVI